MKLLAKLSRDKFSRDVIWNIASLGIVGVFGIAINVVIGLVHGSAALGVFNQVFALYLLLSQFAVLGVHGSVLTYGAAETDPRAQRTISTAGLLLALVQAIIVAISFVLLRTRIASLLGSDAVGEGIRWAAPGIVFLALNKILLATLNARRRMRWYAVFQAGRVVFMGVGVGGALLFDAPASALPVALSIGEGIVFLGAILTVRDQLGASSRGALQEWAGRHWRFGLRGFMSGLFSELNTRIDVIVLGAFATDAIVGAYSFASLLAEGIYQVLIALRTNYAPVIVQHWARGEHASLLRMIRHGRNGTYLAASGMLVVAALGYALLVPWFTTDPLLQDSWIYFAVLLGGMAGSAGYTPFNQLLLWAGRPGSHTISITLIVSASAVANLALASSLGALGSAIAMAATHVWSVFVLKAMVHRVLRLQI